MSISRPSWPGSTWWKFDFHTHTPASKDTQAWQQANGTSEEVTPEKWLLKFMAAEIDCVAVTDHNTGEWIDRLKKAYQDMEAAPPEGFRPLTLFPGVEISVHGGIHILAIFDPSATTYDIALLLGRVGYDGTPGDSDSVTRDGIADVLNDIFRSRAIAIPAHADKDKGLLQCKPKSRESLYDANTVRQAIRNNQLLAVEWIDHKNSPPENIKREVGRLSYVLGSDCHSFRGEFVPGSRYTWVKMASPSLEGLRLALLDKVSLHRSDEGLFNPGKIPKHTISSIEVSKARVMGNTNPARIDCSPFFNAIVGGRGTGKSTLVHALRLATGRDEELSKIAPESELRKQFDAFRQVVRTRDGQGALRPETEISVVWLAEDTRLRLIWRADNSRLVEEQRDGQWVRSESQTVNAARFPIRILSQGQIAALAGSGRALLTIIDEAAAIEPLRQAFEQEKNDLLVMRARLRGLETRLTGLPEIERKLSEVNRKLQVFSQSNHADVLRAYGLATKQHQEVKSLSEQIRDAVKKIKALSEQITLDDLSPTSAQDTDLAVWREDVEKTLIQTRVGLEREAQALSNAIEAWRNPGSSIMNWYSRHQDANDQYNKLKSQLTASGIEEPLAFGRLTQEQQNLERQRRELQQVQRDRDALIKQVDEQLMFLKRRRCEISDRRRSFVENVLRDQSNVRISVVPMGFNPSQLKQELRDLIKKTDDAFASDIEALADALRSEKEDNDHRFAAVDAVKQKLQKVDTSLGGHFRNHLTGQHKQAEFADRILLWFPEDDLRIEYKRDQDKDWQDISQGSQGQRSATLLAFLLAFGEDPIVLDQPEDDLDNHLIYDLIVKKIHENKLRRQLIIITHNPNVVVNGDAELVYIMGYRGQCFIKESGVLQDPGVRHDVCWVMEGGREAFARRWKRLGDENH